MDFRARLRLIAASGLTAMLLAGASAQTPELPEKVPAPDVHPAPAGNIPPKHLGDTPVPEVRPDDAEAAGSKQEAEGKATGTQEPVTPATAPLPPEAPPSHETAPKPSGEDAASPGKSTEPGKDDPAEKPAMQADPRSGQKPLLLMPPAEITCRQRLRTLGVLFTDKPAESDEVGCSMPYPVSVRSLGGDISLKPDALMTCAMAEAAASFVRQVVVPAAKSELGSELKAIDQASAYVCRPRNGTTKLSEHAFGNALDIAGFTLADGRTVGVMLQPEERDGRFLDTVRKAACGPFKTVLGPGSDADHATHLHLDLAPRRNGGTVCE